MIDSTKSFNELLNAVAAKTPAPGGGSVSAAVGALSAALGEMAINFSLGKKGLEAYQDELRPALAEFGRARAILQELLIEDQAAYEAFLAAEKLPANLPDRQGQISAALLMSIRVPETIAATGVAILERCDKLISFVNYSLLADLAVGADLAMATIRCASYSVRANCRLLTDPEDRRGVESRIGQILSRALMLIQSAAPRIWNRIENGN